MSYNTVNTTGVQLTLNDINQVSRITHFMTKNSSYFMKIYQIVKFGISERCRRHAQCYTWPWSWCCCVPLQWGGICVS